MHAQTATDYEYALTTFEKYYNLKQNDSVFTLFSDRIKGIMPQDKTNEMLTRLYSNFGAIKQLDFTKKDQYFSFYKTTFDSGIMTLVVLLNKDEKFQSFRFIQYQPDTTTPALPAKH